MAEWYYSEGDERKGPVPKETLVDLIREGTVKPSELVWTEGMSDWQPVNTIAEFRLELPKPAPERPRNADWYQEDQRPQSREIRERDERDRDRQPRDRDRYSRGRDYRDSVSYGDDRDDYSDERRSNRHYAPHRGGLVLTFGILGIVLTVTCIGPLALGFSIPAMLWGKKDLRAMDQGIMDPHGRGTTMGGYVCGIIGIVLGILYGLVYCTYIGFIIVMVALGK